MNEKNASKFVMTLSTCFPMWIARSTMKGVGIGRAKPCYYWVKISFSARSRCDHGGRFENIKKLPKITYAKWLVV